MNKEELSRALDEFVNENNVISTILYFLLKVDDTLIIRKVDVESDIQDRLTTQFIDYVNQKFIENEELTYMKLSEDDDRKNVAFRYDFNENIDDLNFLDDLLNNTEYPVFNSSNDDINNLYGYVTVTGNETRKLATFRKHYPLDFVNRDKRLYVIPSNERFVQIQSSGFVIDKGFDLIKINGDLVVIKPRVLEKYFGFEEIIKNQSETAITVLEEINFIDDIEGFREFADGNISFQRKLIKAKNSIVLSIDFTIVSDFVGHHSKLKNIIKLNEEKNRFVVNSANSKKVFLSLLNDDFLHSDLTNSEYSAKSKDKI